MDPIAVAALISLIATLGGALIGLGSYLLKRDVADPYGEQLRGILGAVNQNHEDLREIKWLIVAADKNSEEIKRDLRDAIRDRRTLR